MESKILKRSNIDTCIAEGMSVKEAANFFGVPVAGFKKALQTYNIEWPRKRKASAEIIIEDDLSAPLTELPQEVVFEEKSVLETTVEKEPWENARFNGLLKS